MRLSSACYALTGLAYLPPWYVNAGFIAGEHTTLIVDTGGNAAAAATIAGYATAVRTTNRLVAVNTERHFDHILGNSYLFGQGIEVWGHPSIERTESEFAAEIAEYNDAISNAVRRERQEAQVFFGQTRLENPRHRLMPGQVFDLGGVRAEAIFTPGHTPTNTCIWVPSDGVLYAGDCLINGYTPNLESGGVGDWLTWLDSLDLIVALGAKVVLCGHGPVARAGEVARIIAEMRRVLEQAIETGAAPTWAVANS